MSEASTGSRVRPDEFERKLIVTASVATVLGVLAWSVLVVSLPTSLVAAIRLREASRGTRAYVYVLTGANTLIVAALWTYHVLTTQGG